MIKSANEVKNEMSREFDKKRLEFLNYCLYYIETSPREDYLKKELNKLKLHVEIFFRESRTILNNAYMSNEVIKTYYREMESEFEVSKKRKQIRAIEYLLTPSSTEVIL